MFTAAALARARFVVDLLDLRQVGPVAGGINPHYSLSTIHFC